MNFRVRLIEIKIWIIIWGFILSVHSLWAQQTKVYDNPDYTFRQAKDLLEKQQYGGAKKLFGELILLVPDRESLIRREAEYYSALCDYFLNQPEAREKFEHFVKNYPDHTKTNDANLYLAFLEYNSRKFKNAIEYFEKVDHSVLSTSLKTEYLYKLGYSYLQREQFDKAAEAFFPIIGMESPYKDGANFYFAYLAYITRDYDKALFYFNRVNHASDFYSEVPYYLIHIYFIKNDLDKIINQGPEIYRKISRDKKRAGEIARLIAEAFYQKADYSQAIYYFEKYAEDSRKNFTREENYQVGFAHFQNENYPKAISYLEKAVAEQDQLTQNALYHLAYSYLKTGQKKFAQNAFYSTYQIAGNEEIREDALFNYAKLTYELAYDPYNASLASLLEYINTYPASKRIEEAYHYLTSLLLSSKDYQSSINIIESLPARNRNLLTAYQRLTFQNGVQLFNNGKYRQAIENFRKTIKNDYNRGLTASARFWIAESYYRLNEYTRAIDFYQEFKTSPAASSLDIFPLANYNLGYAFFNLELYDDALTSWKNFLSRPGKSDQIYIHDAMLRIGDCYFITRNFSQAANYYEQAVNRNAKNSDYALYQKALSEGALGKSDQKISSLKTLLNRFPNSSLADDATFEIAETYLLRNDPRNAADWFNRVTEKYPSSNYVARSLLKIGLVYYGQNLLDQALEILKKLVLSYPATSEAREALRTIRNIYMDKNEVNKYFDFAQTVPFAQITPSEQDSLTYIAAENLYMLNDCVEAIKAFERYIQRFTNGVFILNAHYYKAECQFRTGKKDEALSSFEFIVNQPRSIFTENSLLRLADWYFEQKNFSTALGYYKNLETVADHQINLITALNGQMECYYQLDNYSEAIQSARKLRSQSNISNELRIRSHYISGKSALALNDLQTARTELENTVRLSQGPAGAEAKYLLASIAYQQKNYTLAENLVFELASQYPAQEYWKAMAFILLADVYIAQGNAFQARQTLQSVIQYYPGQDLKEVARQKLNSIR